MPLRVVAGIERILPRGLVDLLRQIVLFCGAYWLYRLVRGQVDGRAAAAFENAQHIVNLERALGLFVEPAVNSWAEANEWIADVASWLYVNSHFTITTVTLAFLYLRRNDRFYFVRNMFLVSMGIALIGYTVYPTAPPRFFFPEYGFQDTVAQFTGIGHDDTVNALFNPYAAVPSMHCCFAIFIGFTLARCCKHRWARIAWAVWPLVMTWVVVTTANHWIMDAVLGAATAAISYGAAVWLARVRPAAWSFSRVPARATA
jgi:hypothetical protein